MEALKKNLGNIVILIGMIGSIGAAFIKYGELTTQIISMQENIVKLENQEYTLVQNETVNLDPINKRIDTVITEINTKYENVNKTINNDIKDINTKMETINTNINKEINDIKNNNIILKTQDDLLSKRIDGITVKLSNPLLN